MKILLIDYFSTWLIQKLQETGNEISYHPDLHRGEILEILHQYEGLILNSKTQINKPLIDAAGALKWIIRAGVGMDHFDIPYLETKGIIATNTIGANADSVAEHTIGMLLALHHKLLTAHQQVRQGQWEREKNRGLEVKGKTVGIIGYGHTGTAVARKLRGFECRILAYDKYKTGYSTDHVIESNWETIYQEADILSLHIPLTEETLRLADARFFQRFQKPITFLNLARGEIVDTHALYNALLTGKVRAAGLDVLENEKFATLTPAQQALYDTLFHLENVMVSPHIGGWSIESRGNIESAILEQVKAWTLG